MCEIILKREVLGISWFKSSYCTIIKAGFISVFCPKNMFRESGADNGGGWRQSRDLHQLSAEKTWNRKLLSDTKEKLGIDGGDFGGKLRVRILPKTVYHQQGFVW